MITGCHKARRSQVTNAICTVSHITLLLLSQITLAYNITHHTFNHYKNHTTRGRCARRLVAAYPSVPGAHRVLLLRALCVHRYRRLLCVFRRYWLLLCCLCLCLLLFTQLLLAQLLVVACSGGHVSGMHRTPSCHLRAAARVLAQRVVSHQHVFVSGCS